MGLIIGVIVIFYFFGVSDHDVARASVIAGIYVVVFGPTIWWIYHLRKARVIQAAGELGPDEGSQLIN